jgi:thiol oxidase
LTIYVTFHQVSYIDVYFGCRECSRHFMMAAEDGKTIEREIKSPEQAVLWLWRAHNKANRRLSGDLTDDRAFPKETFPNLQHCTHCYDDQALGSDLW